MPRRPFYYRATDGIRVTVRPCFMPAESRPVERRFVFVYAVRIENVGEMGAQLLSRRWIIEDSVGERHEVVGEGVVGLQPRLGPGAVHEYESYCILKSPRGAMEGSYRFRRADGTYFDAAIPRFELEAPEH